MRRFTIYHLCRTLFHDTQQQLIERVVTAALRTLVEAGTGYHANTHNIDRLLRYAALVSYQVPDIFSPATDKAKQLLRLLQQAYTDARYREDYSITKEDLLLLTEKAKTLIDIVTVAGRQAMATNFQPVATV